MSTSHALALVLESRRNLTDSIAEFRFAAAQSGTRLPGFSPGAHLPLQTPSGAMRPYSLISDGGGNAESVSHYSIAVKREDQGRGGSLSMHQLAGAGDHFAADLPNNTFELKPAPAYLFIAGGIGITPIFSMVRALERNNEENYQLIYCTRSVEETAFLQELSSSERLGKVTIHHDHGNPDDNFDLWPLLETPAATSIYCCGPAGLMEAVGDMTGHWPTSAVHFESFQPVQPIRADDSPFKVYLGEDGDEITVAQDQTILQALREHGLTYRSSCESGTCGTCKTRYLSGQVDHRDLCLTDAERLSHLMICVSRSSQGDIVLSPEKTDE